MNELDDFEKALQHFGTRSRKWIYCYGNGNHKLSSEDAISTS